MLLQFWSKKVVYVTIWVDCNVWNRDSVLLNKMRFNDTKASYCTLNLGLCGGLLWKLQGFLKPNINNFVFRLHRLIKNVLHLSSLCCNVSVLEKSRSLCIIFNICQLHDCYFGNLCVKCDKRSNSVALCSVEWEGLLWLNIH